MPTTLEKPRKTVRPSHVRQIAELKAQVAALEQAITSDMGSEKPRLILPELHASNGRIDAQKVADFLCIPLKRLAEGLGLNYKAVHRDPSGESFQVALCPVKRSLEYLHELFQKPASIRVWLNTSHPMLDGKTALEAMVEGKAFAVERLLGNAWDAVVS
jgi:hypothetical protein